MEPMKPMEGMKPMEPMEPMKPMKAEKPWWPGDLESPSSSGSQNDTRYAYFGDSHRLAVSSDGKVVVYDTGDHTINGFGQQQSGGSSMKFDSDKGQVDVASLKVVG